MTTGNSQATGGAMVGGATSTEILQLRAEVARLTLAVEDAQEDVRSADAYRANEWRAQAETQRLRAEAVEARLNALTAALEALEQDYRTMARRWRNGLGWGAELAVLCDEVADRLAALRTP